MTVRSSVGFPQPQAARIPLLERDHWGHATILREFCDCLEDNIHCCALTFAVAQSAETGGVVVLADPALLELPEPLLRERLRRYVWNSSYITVVSVALVVVAVPVVSYTIPRNYHKLYYKFVYFYLLMGLLAPLQVIMLPMA